MKFFTQLIITSFVLMNLSTVSAQAVAITPAVIELSGARGETVSTNIALSNISEQTETYYLSMLKFEPKDETGSPQFIPAEIDNEGLPEWVRFPERVVTISPSATSTISIDIAIPSDVESGSYFAAVVASESSAEIDSNVVVESMTATLLMLTIEGENEENLAIAEFTSSGTTNRLPIEFTYTVQNQGNVYLQPIGMIRVYDLLGKEVTAFPVNTAGGRILPMTNRVYEAEWTRNKIVGDGFMDEVTNEWKNFGLGRYKAELELTYGSDQTIVTQKTVFWIIPWHLFLIAMIFGSILLVATVLREKIAQAIVR